MNVLQFCQGWDLQPKIDEAISAMGFGPSIWAQIADIPVKKSHAVKRFGSYVARGGRPVAIRLQFELDEAELVETFLHELAHCLDHLTHQRGKMYRRPHGDGWKLWARALGAKPTRCGRNEYMQQLQQQRLKIVAVCSRCGYEVRRLRRYPQRRKYVHNECGGRLTLL